MKGEEQIKELLWKHLHEDLSTQEEARLFDLIQNYPAYEDLISKYRSGLFTEDLLDFHLADDRDKQDLTYEYIRAKQAPTPIRKISFLRIAVAAIILIATGIAWMYYIQDPKETFISPSKQMSHVSPGGKKAVLTWEDGKRFELDESRSGIKVQEGQISYEDGTVLYDSLELLTKSQALNLTIPRGGMYQVTLSDGTKVWLNAESTLRYPIQFEGENRLVELTGEAYFEVAHDVHKPFLVQTSKQRLEVLGTRFNISSYIEDEGVVTTLIQGSVKLSQINASSQVAHRQSGVQLYPGQQAVLKQGAFRVQEVDTELFTAWKDGEFVFSSETLGSLMTKIGRWYDIDVRYSTNDLKQRTFIGSISRNKSLHEVLSLLEETGNVRFSLENKTIIVKNK